MTIYGVDIHPTFQSGISIEQNAREGFSWLAVKASQGTSDSWGAGARAWLARGDACGLISFPYHYLTTANVDAQARTAKTAGGGRPIMLDCEKGSGGIANVRAFLAAAGRIGLRVPLVYLPRWWWQEVGSASLAGLPPIVSSRYRTATGPASMIYAGVPESYWASYGGGTTAVLQFSDRASVAGRKIDVNAFRGTKDEFAALIGRPAAPAPAPAPASQRRVLQLTSPMMTGEDVLELQEVLAAWYPVLGLVPDRKFGKATRRAVLHLQKLAHLDEDGIAGRDVYAFLRMT